MENSGNTAKRRIKQSRRARYCFQSSILRFSILNFVQGEEIQMPDNPHMGHRQRMLDKFRRFGL